LQPGVPTGADVREDSDLFAPQSRHPPPGARRETDLAGPHPVASRAQESSELLSSHLCHASIVRPTVTPFHPVTALNLVVRPTPSARPPTPPPPTADWIHERFPHADFIDLLRCGSDLGPR